MKLFILFILIVLIFFNPHTSHSQTKVKNIDSLIIVEYAVSTKLPSFTSTSVRTLLIAGNTSYFFISNPDYEVYDPNNLTASVIKYRDSNYLLVNGSMMPNYNKNTYWRDSLTPMVWHHTGKKESFDGRIGYEARTYFRGRIFTAFYDPLIPISEGPFKFNGLPGLIIKLYDGDNIWDFRIKSIKKVPNNYKVNKIDIAGDFNLYKKIYLEWNIKNREKNEARQNVDINCIDCKTKYPKNYALEKDIEFNAP